MRVRRAVPDEAPALWNIRNQAIRHGCRQSYGAEVIHAWTPEQMPEGYRHAVADNPFYIVENRLGQPVATGYLDIESLSVEAIFTLPEWGRAGMRGFDHEGGYCRSSPTGARNDYA